MFIYKITNKNNGKMYIGYDTGPLEEMRRWKNHRKIYKYIDGREGKKYFIWL